MYSISAIPLTSVQYNSSQP